MSGYSFPTGVDDGFQVELENGVTYEFRAEFQRWDVVKGTGNSVWITDELPDDQYTSNGDLWFDNTEDTMQLFLYHGDSDAWLPVAPPTTLEDRVAEGEEAQRIITGQINVALEEQESLRNKTSKQLSKDEANEVASAFRIKGEGGTYFSVAGNELGLYHLKYPQEGGHAASKQYVDDQITGGGVDESSDYDWTGAHSFSNQAGSVTFSGATSDASGNNDKSWMKFRQNANGTHYLHFGLTNSYWDNRWTLGTGKMTWSKLQTGDPVVQIDESGLQVKGSPVTRNMTMLSALRSSGSFDELKAKLIELLEAEQAEIARTVINGN